MTQQQLSASAPVFQPQSDDNLVLINNNHIVSCSQTDNEYTDTTTHYISNVVDNNPILPLINTTFDSFNTNMLLDSGSSLSLLSLETYNIIKLLVKCKPLSRPVTIKTVNSDVPFSACVRIPFKINNRKFNHPFYITSLNFNNFSGLLGYDFMMKHNTTINPTNQTVNISGLNLPLVNFPLNDKHQHVNTHNVNTHIEENNSNPNEQYVTLVNKSILPANTISYAKVKVDNIPDYDFVFEPSIKNSKVIAYESIHANPQHDNISTNSEIFTFVICLQNASNDPIHLNKNQKVGIIAPIDSIKLKTDPPQQSEFINLIQASPEILNKRKMEISSSDFQLNHLPSEQQHVLSQALLSNYAAFSKSLQTLGHTDKVTPHLSFLHDYPIKCLPYPIPQSLHDEAKKQLDELVDADIIERSNTEWACPMLFVRKKTQNPGDPPKFRMALDLRLLNNIIKSSTYPLPKISTIISNLSSYKYFTLIDLSNAYWQIDLPKELRNIIAFTTPWGCFKTKRLSFGLKTAASTFQHLVDDILHEINLTGIFAYQDDFLIAANSFDEMLQKINKVLEKLASYNITASPSKCIFHQTKIEYLGFQIAHTIVKPVSANIIKITSFPTPKTKRQVKKFTGVCNFYRNMIPGYASLTQPLIDISKPKSTFKWTDNHQSCFETLKNIFFNEPFVKLPQWDKEFIVNTDASSIAISGVLCQYIDNQLHPISYFSKTLSPAEQKYPAIKLELMAIYKTVTAFKYYLYNRTFTVLTDSKPLTHFKKSALPTDITARWLLELSEYTINFKHIPGKENVLADYLSRLNEDPPQENLNNNKSLLSSVQILPIVEEKVLNIHHVNLNISAPNKNDPLLEISLDTIRHEQKNDKRLRKIYRDIKTNKFKKSNANFFIHPHFNLLSYHHHARSVFVLPQTLHAKALTIAHLPHYGIAKTYEFLQNKYYWYGMYADTVNFVKSCEQCVLNKPPVLPKAPLQSNPVSNNPGTCVSLDIVGPLSNHQYILTIIDHFSKHLEMYPLSKITTNNVTECLFKYIATHGRPAAILTDLGTQFISNVFTKFQQVLGIKMCHTTAGHPQTNTAAERINNQIKSTIEILISQKFSFIHAIRIHQILYNGSTHSTTEFSPNLIHFGRSLSLIFDTYNSEIDKQNINPTEYLDNIFKSLKHIYQQTYTNIAEKQVKQNNKIRPNTRLREFKTGYVVYLKSRDKFNKKFTGPYTIIKRNTAVTYSIRLKDNTQADIFKIHVDRLHYVPQRKSSLMQNTDDTKHTQPQDDSTTVNLTAESTNPTDQVINHPDIIIDQCDKNTNDKTVIPPSTSANNSVPPPTVQRMPHTYLLRSRK